MTKTCQNRHNSKPREAHLIGIEKKPTKQSKTRWILLCLARDTSRRRQSGVARYWPRKRRRGAWTASGRRVDTERKNVKTIWIAAGCIHLGIGFGTVSPWSAFKLASRSAAARDPAAPEESHVSVTSLLSRPSCPRRSCARADIPISGAERARLLSSRLTY